MSSQQISVPHGPDRQRMLNVLAQRRYRQRKRQRLQSLEVTLGAGLSGTSAMYASGGEMQLQHSVRPPQPMPDSPGTLINPFYDLCQGFVAEAPNKTCMCLGPHELACQVSGSSSSFVGYQSDFSSLPYGGISQSAASISNSQGSAELQDLETSQFTFPSDHILEIPNLKTMDVSLRISHMLGLTDEFLDLTISRVFDVSRISIPLGDLPESLRPTQAQLLLPHYPVLDVLPWPSLRTRLICLFSQPDELRPPIARGPMAIMRLIQGLDDECEGARVVSSDTGHGYDEKSWEVGQAVYKDWWWVMGPEVVSNSNRLRNLRGAPKLQLSNAR